MMIRALSLVHRYMPAAGVTLILAVAIWVAHPVAQSQEVTQQGRPESAQEVAQQVHPESPQPLRPSTPASRPPSDPKSGEKSGEAKTVDRDYVREYVIGPGDVLEVVVWDNAVISRTVPVRPDGKVSLPLLRDVPAAGQTPVELEEMLKKALTGFIQAPVVTVIVREVHSFKVSVLGQVKTPGRYELGSRATVLDVIALAGGLTEFADRGDIVILRRDGTQTWQIPFSYDRMTSGSRAKPQENIFVEPNDIVVVK